MITICDIVLAWATVGLLLVGWEWWDARQRQRVSGQQQQARLS